MSNNEKKPTFLRTDRGRIIATVIGATALVGATFGAQAIAESRAFQHAKLYVTETGDMNPFVHKAGWGERGGRHNRRSGWANLSDAEIESRIERFVKHAAIEIDANAEQTQKITALLATVAKDMKPLRGDFREAGEKMRELLTAGTIDREAIEALRKERLAVIDSRSQQLTGALADVAEVLTPEQRVTLEERIEEFRSMRGRWHGRG